MNAEGRSRQKNTQVLHAEVVLYKTATSSAPANFQHPLQTKTPHLYDLVARTRKKRTIKTPHELCALATFMKSQRQSVSELPWCSHVEGGKFSVARPAYVNVRLDPEPAPCLIRATQRHKTNRDDRAADPHLSFSHHARI